MRSRMMERSGLALVAAGLGLGLFAVPALAQTDPDAGLADEAQILDWANEYLSEFNNADLDGDGNADFADTNGDGVPEIPIGERGDLDLRPGDGRFGTEIGGQVSASVSTSDASSLLFDCSGMAISFDANGAMVDWALGVGSSEGGGPAGQMIDLFPSGQTERAFTKSNPFVVVDKVVYFGRMPGAGDGARNHVWSVTTAGISIDEGGDDNPDGNNRNAGQVSISEDVPAGSLLIPSGIFPITGSLDSENDVRCEGSGWVRFDTGNPVLSAAGGVAALLGLGGIFGLLFNARPAITWRA